MTATLAPAMPGWSDPNRLSWEMDRLREKFGECEIGPHGLTRLVTIHRFPLPSGVWRDQECVSVKPNHLGGTDTRFEDREILTRAKVYFVVPCSYPGAWPCSGFFTQPMRLVRGGTPRGSCWWHGCWSVDYNVSCVPSGSQWWRLNLYKWDSQRGDTLLSYARVIQQRLRWES